jgi:16S rRNA (guanine966-N2)-methyltransferase
MRITGGVWGSRRIKGPARGQRLRPTPDSMRERCFAVLADRVAGARVLDLFAGTGAVGLEALSRGADSALFVEAHRPAAGLIRANIASLGVDPDRASVLVRPAARAVVGLARSGLVFDLIWADPPFEVWREGLDALAAALDGGLLAAGGTACLECPAEADVAAALPPRLVIERDLKGGASRVVMLVFSHVQGQRPGR